MSLAAALLLRKSLQRTVLQKDSVSRLLLWQQTRLSAQRPIYLNYKPGAKGWHQAINILLINIQVIPPARDRMALIALRQ